MNCEVEKGEPTLETPRSRRRRSGRGESERKQLQRSRRLRRPRSLQRQRGGELRTRWQGMQRKSKLKLLRLR